MKSYTSLEQSKKLAGILPSTTIDFAWNIFCDGSTRLLRMDDWEVFENAKSNVEIIPCWSFAALLSVLPTTIGNIFEKNALRLRMDKGEKNFNIWYENFDCGDVSEGLDVIEDNPVDACVELINKLHELNLL